LSTQEIFLDQEGINRLKEEIKLTEKQLTEIHARIGNLNYRSKFGDVSETSEAASLITEERMLSHKLAELRYNLTHSTIIERPPTGTVGTGVTVKVVINDAEAELVKIVTASPKIFDGEISIDSPLYKAIAGKQAGYVGSYTVGDSTITVKILEIM